MKKKTVNLDENERYMQNLVASVIADFNMRREERLSIEKQWQLNVNYLMGNQYAEITPTGEVKEENKYYYWQSRNVYNHIAPIIETRLSKLSNVPSQSWTAARLRNRKRQFAPAMIWTSFLPTLPPTVRMRRHF